MFLAVCVVFILITCLHFDFFPCVAVSACICSFACVYDIILLGVFRVCFDFDIYCFFLVWLVTTDCVVISTES